MVPALSDAIRKRALTKLSYDGYHRLVEPYAYGMSTAHNEVLRCYQVSGGSASGESPGWKLLRVDRIGYLQPLNETFAPRSDYARGDKGMATIHCEV